MQIPVFFFYLDHFLCDNTTDKSFFDLFIHIFIYLSIYLSISGADLGVVRVVWLNPLK